MVPVIVGDYVRDLYEALRQAGREGVARIFCQRVPEHGLGRALMDRITRAARGK